MVGRRTFFFEGLGVSQGIAIGPAYVLETQGLESEPYQLGEEDLEEEIARFLQAVELAREEVRDIGRQVAEKIDRQQAAIFDAHLMMLEDPQIVERTIEQIRSEKINAEAVLWQITQALGEQMKALGDPYFAERNHDLYDVTRRVQKFLRKLSAQDQEVPREGCIIVANDLGPAETAQLSRDHVLGFCTNEGGATGHAAILAKALSIPAVVGLEFVTHYIRNGDMLVLDGTEGKVILNPTDEQIEFFRRKASEFDTFRQSLEELRDMPAETTDGVRIAMFANIELPEEMDNVHKHGAEGIGLFRTEFLYLDRATLPTEAEHVGAYREVIHRMDNMPVVMRTLDLGGDKMPDREFVLPEANPFMGMRAIRLCMLRPDIFRTQLRAMLIAGADRVVDIMVPMVSGLTEVRATRQVIEELLKQLRGEGIATPSHVRLGAMIEIPSAALMAPAFCREVDFLSIGTNDLVQYTLAVDRINKSVATLYRQTHPAVLRLIKMVVDAGAESNTPVSVCGEMASDPRLAVLLVGLGIRTLSMGPSSINQVKRVLRAISAEDAQRLAQEVLHLATPEEVESHLTKRLREVFDQLKASEAAARSRPLSAG